ncbi:uncharacterized protein JCM6883_006152 [Sporobolomyces salmoneus]|uniref:uncharacterized protein n=1 Tax=Sporobolomyces salmoneus TaxID=183962 RepID=UPI00317796FA
MKLLRVLYRELGIQHLRTSSSPRDVYLLILCRFLRLLGFGSIAPLLVLFLQELRLSDVKIGVFLGLTLFGDVALSLLISWIADGVGRRRVLAIGSGMMGLSGITFACSSNYALLLLGACLGVLSTSGNECGLVEKDDRGYVLVWYQVLGFVGIALGSILSGSAVTALESESHSTLSAYRVIFAFYSLVAIIKVVLSLCLSGSVEANGKQLLKAPEDEPRLESERAPLLRSTPSTPRLDTEIPVREEDVDAKCSSPAALPMGRLSLTCVLFSVDSFASALVPASYVALYLKSVYFLELGAISKVIASAALGAVITSIAAGAISKRAGLVLAMVSFHIPAQILQGGMGFVPSSNASAVIALYIAKTCLSSLDSSVRGAFLSAMVPAESRTRFLGLVDVSRSLSAGFGPFVTGRLGDRLDLAFVISAGLKIAADVALLASFWKVTLVN